MAEFALEVPPTVLARAQTSITTDLLWTNSTFGLEPSIFVNARARSSLALNVFVPGVVALGSLAPTARSRALMTFGLTLTGSGALAFNPPAITGRGRAAISLNGFAITLPNMYALGSIAMPAVRARASLTAALVYFDAAYYWANRNSSAPPQRYDFTAKRGDTIRRVVSWKQSNGTPIDTAGLSAAMNLRRAGAESLATPEVQLTSAAGDITFALGEVRFKIASTVTAALQGEVYGYDLECYLPNGDTQTLIYGDGTFFDERTR